MKIYLTLALLLLGGCASQSGWTPTVDTHQEHVYQPQGQNRAYPPVQYQQQQDLNQDMVECKQLASQASGGTAKEGAIGALGGAALGAAGGAIIGAFTGSAGTGAALGAATGGLAGGAYKGLSAEDAYKQAYSNCLRNRGFKVVN